MDQAPAWRQRRPVSSAERRRTAPAPRRARPARRSRRHCASAGRPSSRPLSSAVFGHILGRALAGLQRAARQPARPPTGAARRCRPPRAPARLRIPAQLLGQVGHHLGQRRVAGNMRGLGHVRRLTAGQARQRQFSGETVSVTSGTTAGSDSSASPSLPMVRPARIRPARSAPSCRRGGPALARPVFALQQHVERLGQA